jgi:hypothetical protein
VNVFADVMLDDFNPWVSDFIGGALQGPVKTLVNQKLNNLVVTADDTCAAHEVWASDEFEFLELDKIPEIMLPPSSDPSSASDAASLIGKDLMDRIVDGFLSPSGINSFIDCFVQALVGGGGTVVDIAPMDGFRIQIKDAFVNGMDSFYALDLSIPDPYRYVRERQGAAAAAGPPASAKVLLLRLAPLLAPRCCCCGCPPCSVPCYPTPPSFFLTTFSAVPTACAPASGWATRASRTSPSA